MVRFEDGTGTGNAAKVDEENRVHTQAISISEPQQQTKQGNSYDIDTAVINLTSGNPSALLFIKNNEDFDLVLEAIFPELGNSVGGVTPENVLVEVIKNPTAGSLITGGTDVATINRNMGSSNVLVAVVKKGAEASTITDGTPFIFLLFSGVGAKSIPLDLTIPKGSSIAIRVTPFGSNTSMDVKIGARVFLDTLFEESG